MLTTAYKRIGATTAIAAALALTPAIAAAQQTDSTTSTTSTTTDTAPPADAAPADAAPAPSVDVTPTPDTSTRATAPVASRHVTRTVTTRTTHVAPLRAEAPQPVVVAPVQTAPAAAPLAAVPPPPDASLAPAEPVAAAPAPVASPPPSHFGETLLEFGAGLIGLLALAWIALALTRRRRVRDEIEEYDYTEPAAEPVAEPVVEPIAMAEPALPVEPEPEPAPSGGIVTSGLRVTPAASYFSDRPAFDWDDKTERAEGVSTDDDRLPGESWTERARRGPSADNPSLSLKKRLKRAAFFEHREREAAAGRAVPVDPDAGLPESITDDGDLQAA